MISRQNRTAGPLTGSIPILGGSSADKLSGPPPSRKVSTSWSTSEFKSFFCRNLNQVEFKWWPTKRECIQARLLFEEEISFFYFDHQVLGNMDFSVPPPGFDPTLPPPTGNFCLFSEMAGFMFLLSGGPPPDLSGPPPSGEFPPSGENSFPFHNFTEEPRWVSSQSSRH